MIRMYRLFDVIGKFVIIRIFMSERTEKISGKKEDMCMEHIIIGTAGHIDHGKTSLIHALTGRDTDTKKEEKDRGISIDLGFTWFDLPDGNRAGIVDVPGHEKFLPNMLSGVYGMDLVLLVIALDEGIKPQTKEHMEILSQLHIKNGILVFTKSDLVDGEWKELILEEVHEELQETAFAAWPEICVSSVTGDGIELLKQMIVERVAQTHHVRDISGPFRMPIDRCFSLNGRGTVIAGTIMEGAVRSDDKVMLYPQETEVRIRSIQIHGQAVEAATAGQRTALLIPGIKKDDIKRGNIVAAIHSMCPTERVDVKITVSNETKRIVKHQSRLHLHIGAGQVLCRVILFGKNELHPGESGYAQLVVEEKIAVKKRDPFVLRFYSPLETIGGGVVLDAVAKKHKRSDPAVLEELQRKEENKESDVLLRYLRKSSKSPVIIAQIKDAVSIEEKDIQKILTELEQQRLVVRLQGKKNMYYWSYDSENDIWDHVRTWLLQYHQTHPYRYGAWKKELQREAFSGWEMGRFEAYLSYLESSEKQESRIERDGDRIKLREFVIQKDTVFLDAERYVHEMFCTAGYQMLSSQELCPKNLGNECFMDILMIWKEEGKLVAMTEMYYAASTQVESVIQKVRAHFQEQKMLTYSELRDMLNTSRKTAKLWMAYLDEQRITMRCGNETERVQYKDKKDVID